MSDGSRMAAKVLPLSSLADANKLRRVQNEIDISQLLRHPHVVTFLGSFQDAANVYLLQELCCMTLGELLKRMERFSEHQAAHVLWQVLSAQEHLHGCGVVHRDLKLSNLFLGRDGAVKLGDLGLACHLGSPPTARRRSTCGSLNWMAPEVLAPGPSGYGFEVDVWALGVVLHTLLAGRPPFAGPSGSREEDHVQATYARILSGRYELPSRAIDGTPISTAARCLLASLLSVDPTRRPSLAAIRAHPFFREQLGGMALVGPSPGLREPGDGSSEGTPTGGADECCACEEHGAGFKVEGEEGTCALEASPVDLRLVLQVAPEMLLRDGGGSGGEGGGGRHYSGDRSSSGSYMDLSQSEPCSMTTATTSATTVTGPGGHHSPRGLPGQHSGSHRNSNSHALRSSAAISCRFSVARRSLSHQHQHLALPSQRMSDATSREPGHHRRAYLHSSVGGLPRGLYKLFENGTAAGPMPVLNSSEGGEGDGALEAGEAPSSMGVPVPYDARRYLAHYPTRNEPPRPASQRGPHQSCGFPRLSLDQPGACGASSASVETLSPFLSDGISGGGEVLGLGLDGARASPGSSSTCPGSTALIRSSPNGSAQGACGGHAPAGQGRRPTEDCHVSEATQLGPSVSERCGAPVGIAEARLRRRATSGTAALGSGARRSAEVGARDGAAFSGAHAQGILRMAFLSHTPSRGRLQNGAGRGLGHRAYLRGSGHTGHSGHTGRCTSGHEEHQNDVSMDTPTSYADSLEAVLLGGGAAGGAAMPCCRVGPAPVARAPAHSGGPERRKPAAATAAATAASLISPPLRQARTFSPTSTADGAQTASSASVPTFRIILRHGRGSSGGLGGSSKPLVPLALAAARRSLPAAPGTVVFTAMGPSIPRSAPAHNLPSGIILPSPRSPQAASPGRPDGIPSLAGGYRPAAVIGSSMLPSRYPSEERRDYGGQVSAGLAIRPSEVSTCMGGSPTTSAPFPVSAWASQGSRLDGQGSAAPRLLGSSRDADAAGSGDGGPAGESGTFPRTFWSIQPHGLGEHSASLPPGACYKAAAASAGAVIVSASIPPAAEAPADAPGSNGTVGAVGRQPLVLRPPSLRRSLDRENDTLRGGPEHRTSRDQQEPPRTVPAPRRGPWGAAPGTAAAAGDASPGQDSAAPHGAATWTLPPRSPSPLGLPCREPHLGEEAGPEARAKATRVAAQRYEQHQQGQPHQQDMQRPEAASKRASWRGLLASGVSGRRSRSGSDSPSPSQPGRTAELEPPAAAPPGAWAGCAPSPLRDTQQCEAALPWPSPQPYSRSLEADGHRSSQLGCSTGASMHPWRMRALAERRQRCETLHHIWQEEQAQDGVAEPQPSAPYGAGPQQGSYTAATDGSAAQSRACSVGGGRGRFGCGSDAGPASCPAGAITRAEPSQARRTAVSLRAHAHVSSGLAVQAGGGAGCSAAADAYLARRLGRYRAQPDGKAALLLPRPASGVLADIKEGEPWCASAVPARSADPRVASAREQMLPAVSAGAGARQPSAGEVSLGSGQDPGSERPTPQLWTSGSGMLQVSSGFSSGLAGVSTAPAGPCSGPVGLDFGLSGPGLTPGAAMQRALVVADAAPKFEPAAWKPRANSAVHSGSSQSTIASAAVPVAASASASIASAAGAVGHGGGADAGLRGSLEVHRVLRHLESRDIDEAAPRASGGGQAAPQASALLPLPPSVLHASVQLPPSGPLAAAATQLNAVRQPEHLYIQAALQHTRDQRTQLESRALPSCPAGRAAAHAAASSLKTAPPVMAVARTCSGKASAGFSSGSCSRAATEPCAGEVEPEAVSQLAGRLHSRSFGKGGSRAGSFTYRPSRMMPSTHRSPGRSPQQAVAQPAPELREGEAGGHGAQAGAATAERELRHVLLVKWLDYSNKYGLSYLLSNGTVGVLFRDGTQLVYDGGTSHAWLSAAASDTGMGCGGACSGRGNGYGEAAGAACRAGATVDNLVPVELEARESASPAVPHDLAKKLKLLRGFRRTLLGEGRSEPASGSQASQQQQQRAQQQQQGPVSEAQDGAHACKPGPSVGAGADAGGLHAEAVQLTRLRPPAVRIRRWARTGKALVAAMTSGTLQALFLDGSELVVREADDEVDFLSRDGRRHACSLRVIRLAGPRNSIVKRIEYATELIRTRGKRA